MRLTRHQFLLTALGSALALGALPSCGLFDSDDPEEEKFCTIEPTEITVQTGASVTFAAECSGQLVIDERSWVNGSYIAATDNIAWSAPLIPGEYEAYVYLGSDPSVRATAAVTVLEDPIDLPSPTVWRIQRGQHDINFSPDGSSIASLGATALSIWDADTFQQVGITDHIGASGFDWNPVEEGHFVLNGGTIRYIGGYSGVVELDAQSNAITRSYVPRDAIGGSAYSPDGRYILAYDGGTIWLDEVATDGHTAWIQLRDDLVPSVWVWQDAVGMPELEDDELLALPISTPVSYAYFTEDSSQVVIMWGNPIENGSIREVTGWTYIDVETGLEAATFAAPHDGFWVPHPDGVRFVGGGFENGLVGASVYITDENGDLAYQPDWGTMPGYMSMVAVSPDGRYVAVQTLTPDSPDAEVATGYHLGVFDLQRLEWLWTIFPEENVDGARVFNDVPILVAWDDADRILVMQGERGAVWGNRTMGYVDPMTGDLIHRQVMPNGPVERVRWNPDGTRAYWLGFPLSNVNQDKLLVYDEHGQLLWYDDVAGADWVESEPDQIITIGAGGLAWRNADTGEVIRTASLSTGVGSIAVSDDQTMVIGWNNGAGGHILQDIETGERLNALITGADLTRPYDWTPDGIIFDDTGKSWNPQTQTNARLPAPYSMPNVESDVIDWCFEDCTNGNQTCTQRCEARPVCFTFSPTGGRVAIAESGINRGMPEEVQAMQQIRILDYPTLVERGVFEAHNIGSSCSMDWHPSRAELLVGSDDLIWSLDITTTLE
ncbi:MAG: hypothetical protein KC561_06840 [Myxococcales bacterium]|nr:hypothetical protein [Myxococcales bacterium]